MVVRKLINRFLVAYVSAVFSMYMVLAALMYKFTLQLDYELLFSKFCDVLTIEIAVGLVGVVIPDRFNKLRVVIGVLLGPIVGVFMIKNFYV